MKIVIYYKVQNWHEIQIYFKTKINCKGKRKKYIELQWTIDTYLYL